MTVARSATRAVRRACSNSASCSTRTPRAPHARAIAAKSTGPSSVATPTPVFRRSCHIRIVPYRSLSKQRTTTRAPTRTAVSSSATRHAESAVADESHDVPVAMDERGRDRRGQAVAHRPGCRAEERPRAAKPEPPRRPATEVAGIGGQDRRRPAAPDEASRSRGPGGRPVHPTACRRRRSRPPTRRGRRRCSPDASRPARRRGPPDPEADRWRP